MKIRKLIFFVPTKSYAEVVNMYFLIARAIENKLSTNNFVLVYEIHIIKSYSKIYYSLKI